MNNDSGHFIYYDIVSSFSPSHLDLSFLVTNLKRYLFRIRHTLKPSSSTGKYSKDSKLFTNFVS